MTPVGLQPKGWLLLLSFLLLIPGTAAQTPAHATGRAAAGVEKDTLPRGLEIIQNGGYPELRVDSKPFFIHSAAFFYYRIPPDLWESSLDRHRELGINTIDLYFPWNWHEPREGELDFEGRTNPRRNLRALLKLITDKGFRIIARPGPVILNEWRHGGYPEWLLERPEYNMDARDRLEGRYTPLSNLNARDAEGAAKGWLDNPTHLAFTRKWLARVAQELAPYSVHRTLHVRRPVPDSKKGETQEVEISGPLLFVQLDDDMAIGRSNYAGPEFWRYMEELRRMLEAGGVDVPFYINPTDMRVSAAGFALEKPIGAMGQWYLQPPAAQLSAPPPRKIGAQDAATLEFFVEELKTQPAFPPLIIEYQAGWYSPAEDARPVESPPVNTLLSSRLLLAHGLHGLNYFPLQDMITPAGFEVPWANRYYRWDAALDPNGNPQPRARAVARNGHLMELWAEFLASSHKRADFGIIYPLGAYPQESLARQDIQRISQAVMRLERLAHLAGLSSELLDPQYQPVEQLLRHALILLPVFDSGQGKFPLSETAQRALVEYVRHGGTLAYFPARPSGKLLEELWAAAPSASGGVLPDAKQATAAYASWAFGPGRVVEINKDFYSWVDLSESFAANRGQAEAAAAVQTLMELVSRAEAHPVVERSDNTSPAGELVVTQLVSNEGTSRLGHRKSGQALLSVTNLGDDAAEEALKILSPLAGARSAADDRISLRVAVPPGESLLLPLHFPLCAAAKPAKSCTDEVLAAGAELLRVEREGRALELTFYAPSKATVLLQLEKQPLRVHVDEMSPQGTWTVERRQFEFEVLRGAAPDYLRVAKVQLPYAPHVPEKPDPAKHGRRDYDYEVSDAVRLPLAGDTSLRTYPPLVVVKEDLSGRLIVQAQNYDEMGRDIEIKVEGPVRGLDSLGLDAGELGHERVDLKPAREPGSNAHPNGEKLFLGQLQVRSGKDARSMPIAFLAVGEEGVTPYQFDFDRDGANEWVLEDKHLRLVVSPESGGRALALVDKESGLNVITSAGAFRDHFSYAESAPGTRPERARGRAGLFNRAYHAEWVKEEKNTALRLTYDAPDVYPAGAQIEKTVRLAGPQVVEVDYAVSLAAGASGPPAVPDAQQSFVAVNSVPTLVHGDRTTQFCWVPPEQATNESKSSKPADSADELHCEPFVPGGSALEIPPGVTELRVRTPGSFALHLQWKAGKMNIQMKQFSALLKLQFPALTPGGEPGRYQVRYSMVVVE